MVHTPQQSTTTAPPPAAHATERPPSEQRSAADGSRSIALPVGRATALLLGVVLVGLFVVGAASGIGAADPSDPSATAGTSAAAEPVGITEPVASDAVSTSNLAALDTGQAGGAPASVNGSFSRDLYTTTTGDPAEVAVIADGEPTYLLVGGNRLSDPNVPVGYTDVIRIEGDGRVDLTLNTRLAGTGKEYVSTPDDSDATVTSCAIDDCSSELTFMDEDGDKLEMGDLPTATGAGGLVRPLAPQRYRLAIVENATFTVDSDGAVAPAAASERSNLRIVGSEDHLGESVEVFTTMSGEAGGDTAIDSVSALRSDGLERDAVTKGDRLVIGVEAAGVWGALSHLADERGETVEPGENATGAVLGDLLDVEEGVSLRIEQTNPGQNRAPTRIGADALGNATLLFESAEEFETAPNDPSPGRLYLVIDTSDDNGIGARLDPGDEYRVTFELHGERGSRYQFASDSDDIDADAPFAAASVDDDGVPEQFPFLSADDDGVSATTTVAISERYLRYDNTLNDGRILVDGDAISGTTTLLPATDLHGEFAYDGGETPQLSDADVSIDDGGNFTVDPGVADVPLGGQVTFDLYADDVLYDSRTLVVVDDIENPNRLRLENATTNVTVTRGESLDDLSTTVRNVGAVDARDSLSLDVDDGAIVEERRVRVSPDASHNETFADLDIELDPGEYPYTLTVEDDEVSGVLNVVADPAVTQIDDDDGAADEGDDADGDADAADDVSMPDEPETNESDGATDTDATPTDDESPDEDQSGTTPALLPVGTREAFGGTVLVGATYLLGHWV